MVLRSITVLLVAATMSAAKDLVAIGCDRDPTLAFCPTARALASVTHRMEDNGDRITEKDKQACSELRMEYVKVCATTGVERIAETEREFCAAFENICFKIPKGEPDQATVPPTSAPEALEEVATSTPKPKKRRIDFTRFCKEFKNRYLFVCPDPFRFGQKAVVFCPIYSDRCHVPLPDKPVVPTRRPPKGSRTSTVDRICRSYRGFADAYCSNPILLAQQQYREGCEKYWRFCTNRG